MLQLQEGQSTWAAVPKGGAENEWVDMCQAHDNCEQTQLKHTPHTHTTRKKGKIYTIYVEIEEREMRRGWVGTFIDTIANEVEK